MSGRSSLSRTGILAGLAVLVGVVCALLWANLSVLPEYTVQADGHATMNSADLAEVFSATFWFSVLGFVGGIALGLASWVALRSIGWLVALLAAALALVGALTCWGVGWLLGPGAFAVRMAAAQPGDLVSTPLQLAAPSAIAVWVFAAVAVPLFAASLGPEVDADRPRTRRRRSTAGAEAATSAEHPAMEVAS